jgi:cobalt/nickel transport system permease protein
MHIPDGYLSPATCAALYGAAAPFWYVAMRRLRAVLHTRVVPHLALFAAFAFVVMMFNIPLPGGSSGHAAGTALSTIVLGPAASILAISIAVVIQAFFFGDGGITAIGANCFNMAVVGSLVAFAVYRALAHGSSLTSARRMVAAGLAGYVALNAAALCAAVEFGIQPLFYRDAYGAPLYCPYPLGVAVPAMMIGHLTVAGIAELVLTASVVAFLQRSDPAVLARAAGRGAGAASARAATATSTLRPLWLALGIMLVLTPLGVLTAGSAWGEWAASDFNNPEARREMAAVSLNQAPPGRAPAGLARWSSVWTAPFAEYAPPYLSGAGVGYVLSAMFGVGLVVLAATGLGALAGARRPRDPFDAAGG